MRTLMGILNATNLKYKHQVSKERIPLKSLVLKKIAEFHTSIVYVTSIHNTIQCLGN